MLGKKECFMEKFFLATLWAKLSIITVNFGYKTKVFSESFGWYVVTLKHKHLAFTCSQLLKSRKQSQRRQQVALEPHPVAVVY